MKPEEIIARYKNGETSEQIAADAGVSYKTILRTLKKYGVSIRQKGRPRVHKANTSFFKTWTNEMAYVLGMIYADGSILPNQYRISITQRSEKTLYMLAKLMGCEPNIVPSGKEKYPTLNVNSKEMVLDLLSLGITPAGEWVRKVPNVSEPYFSHFIRGVFDGDAHFSQDANVIIMRTGSRALSKRLMEQLQDLKVTADLDHKYDKYLIRIVGIESLRNLYEWLYQNAKQAYITEKRQEFTKRFDEDVWKQQQKNTNYRRSLV